MTNSNKIILKDLSRQELGEFIMRQGLESFRARQLFHWLYQKNVTDFSQMTTLKKEIREAFREVAEINLLNAVSIASSQIEPTHKFLFALPDGNRVESVYMEEAKRRTICVSSQVGCALNCDFCATGKMGFRRNLSVGEIVDQVLWIERYTGKEATNIVMMGMGEPFLNFDAVIRAAELFSDPEGIAISKRKITISTAGIVPGIERFTQEGHRFKLAISLNATTDEIRKKLMPIAKKYPLSQLLTAVKKYTDNSPYRVTFEYLLIAGVNDSLQDAKRLRKLLAHIPCKINLIPYNSVDSRYQSVSDRRLNEFIQELATFSAPVTVRRSKGLDIQAACGQLYTQNMQSGKISNQGLNL